MSPLRRAKTERLLPLGEINLTRGQLDELASGCGVVTAEITADGDSERFKVAEVNIYAPWPDEPSTNTEEQG